MSHKHDESYISEKNDIKIFKIFVRLNLYVTFIIFMIFFV